MARSSGQKGATRSQEACAMEAMSNRLLMSLQLAVITHTPYVSMFWKVGLKNFHSP